MEHEGAVVLCMSKPDDDDDADDGQIPCNMA
jgi:hypothetical protein